MAQGLQAQWDACYGPTNFGGNVNNSAAVDAAHFQQRVAMAVSAQAVAVCQEVTTTTNHPNRVAMAKDALNNPAKYTAPFAQAMAANGLDEGSTDSAILGAVAFGWDFFAGLP